jgi:putative FmdB family regulatory protein
MPIYEYQCALCEHKMEALQKMSDDPLTDCPECAKPGLKKLISAASFRLKGSGWYETDFKTGDKKQLAESDSGKTPATGDAGKADAKSGKNSPSGEKSPADSGTSSSKSSAKEKTSSKLDSKSPAKTGGNTGRGSK